MANTREQKTAEVDQTVIDHLRVRGTSWVTAKEIAMELGEPWKRVAAALARLSRSGVVEVDTEEWVSSRFRVRKRAIYRFWTTPSGNLYPTWLMPRAEDLLPGMGYMVTVYSSQEAAND